MFFASSLNEVTIVNHCEFNKSKLFIYRKGREDDVDDDEDDKGKSNNNDEMMRKELFTVGVKGYTFKETPLISINRSGYLDLIQSSQP